jgi:hypothetical protein
VLFDVAWRHLDTLPVSQGACGGTPLVLSFWLAANLPLDNIERHY